MQKKHQKRNSTIKQEQQHVSNNKDINNTSSIQLNENTDVHYYDLDYSDQHQDNDIVSSSDQDGREISHEQFMKMITTNKQMHEKKLQNENDQQYHEEQSNYRRSGNHVRSQDFKLMYNKRSTPATKDKSYNMNQHGNKHRVNHSNLINDPQKSTKHKNQLQNKYKSTKHHSNQINQFKVDSYLNLPNFEDYKQKQQKRIPHNKYTKNQDESFSLITLPEYDEQQNGSQLEQNVYQKKRNYRIFPNKKRVEQRVKKQEKQNNVDNLNWRYQEAKLKFLDNFMPDSMKIGSNPYNMLKYINKKNQFSLNILSIL